MTPPEYRLLTISDLREGRDGVLVSFSDSSTGMLRSTDLADGTILRYLRLAREGQRPVAVLLERDGWICDVAGVVRDIVLGVKELDGTPPVMGVCFSKMDGWIFLLKDHPKFQEIMAALTEAIASQQPVWYITRSSCILDVLHLDPAEEAALGQPAGS
jgi:hypothetical protein